VVVFQPSGFHFWRDFNIIISYYLNNEI